MTVKAAMTLDGKIATASGESKWITGPSARREGMKLRHEADAIVVGVNTILADDPSLTVRDVRRPKPEWRGPELRRIVLDPRARIPLDARVLNDELAAATTVVVSADAPAKRLAKLKARCGVMTCRLAKRGFQLRMLLKRLAKQDVTSLLVEGGGETNAAFVEVGLVDRVAFFMRPKFLAAAMHAPGWLARGCRWRPGCRWKKSAGEILAPT